MSWNVFVTAEIPEAGLELLRQHCAVVEVSDKCPIEDAELLAQSRNRDGLLIMAHDQVDSAVFDASPKLRAVSNHGAGFNNINLQEASRRGIAVTYTPGLVTEATADLTWALLLAVARRVLEGDQLVHSGNWKGPAPMLLLGTDVYGKTLGIVGAGRIGTAVARRAVGFSMRLLYCSRQAHPEIESHGARWLSLDQILRESDFLCVHVPQTTSTYHMFSEKEFRQMKPTAFFINVARGPIHDEGALERALREKWIAGAGLDVFENEPHVRPGVLSLPNVVLLPHIGSATIETRTRMAILAAENLLAMLRGQRCQHLLNPEVLKKS